MPRVLPATHSWHAQKYEVFLVATTPNPLLDPMRGRDPYRGQFNQGPPQYRE